MGYYFSMILVFMDPHIRNPSTFPSLILISLMFRLIFRNEALRVAFIHVEENIMADGKVSKEFYSKLVKADIHGKDQVDFFS